MIANVSPSIATFDDTYNTLKYANRAKNIKTQVTRNVTNAQYHISNYNQIISNLRNEIVELKNQLGKKDPNNVNINLLQEKNFLMNNINNNNPGGHNSSKSENKKEDYKENKHLLFEKAVKELKSHLQEEYLLQNKIAEQEKEISKTSNFLNQQNEEFLVKKSKGPGNYSSKTLINLNHKNDGNITEIIEDTQRMQTEPNKENENSENNKEPNINNLNVKEKFINLLDQNNSIQTDMDGDLNTINNTYADKEIFLAKLKKNFDRNTTRFNEMQQKKDILLNIYAKNGIKDYQFEYLKSLVKNQNFKYYITESKEKDKLNASLLDVKEDYISLLENQLKLRDEVITKNNLETVFEENDEIKTLENLRKEYANKLPPIISRSKNQMNVSSLLNRKSIEHININDNEKNILG